MGEEYRSKDQGNLDEIPLRELFFKIRRWYKYIFSKWIIIVLVATLGVLLGFGYSQFKRPLYVATTTFVLEDGGMGASSLGNLGGLASIAGIDVGSGGLFQGDNILELYRSRKMIEKALLTEVEYEGNSQLLVERYIAFNNLRTKWGKTPGLKNLDFRKVNLIKASGSKENSSRSLDSVLGLIVSDINKNYLNVGKPDKKLSIVKAEVKAPDEFFAKTFNNLIVNNVNDFYIQTKTKRSLENVMILQQKVDSVRRVMNGAINSAAAIADATPNLNITRQIQRLAPIQRSQFSAETNKSILGELVKNLELSKISLRKEMPLLQVIDEPIFPLLIDKPSALISSIFMGTIFAIIILVILSISYYLRNE